MTKPDGGAAFPFHGNANEPCTSGMSLRDWFAGMAVSSMQDGTPEIMARVAYERADALLEARRLEKR